MFCLKCKEWNSNVFLIIYKVYTVVLLSCLTVFLAESSSRAMCRYAIILAIDSGGFRNSWISVFHSNLCSKHDDLQVMMSSRRLHVLVLCVQREYIPCRYDQLFATSLCLVWAESYLRTNIFLIYSGLDNGTKLNTGQQ